MNTLRPPIERFWEKVFPEPNSGCWLWGAATTNEGYGMLGKGRSGEGNFLAHRFSYEYFRGPIPDKYQLDHLCRIPCCVNPQHLEIVSPGENIRRGLLPEINRKRGRAVTHCAQGHPFSSKNTYITKTGKRACRECARLRYHNKKQTHQQVRLDGRLVWIERTIEKEVANASA